VGSPLGPKIRIGKYKAKKGYRRHTGFRAKLSEIEIQTIGATRSSAAKQEEPKAEAKPKPAAKPRAASKPRAAAAKKPATRKTPARKPATRTKPTEKK
jgi:hypothetical protein